MQKLLLTLTFLFFSLIILKAQPIISGDLQVNQNFYIYDSLVFPVLSEAPPQYKKQLSSTEAWLNINYRNDDLTIGARFDLFNNSGLRNPLSAYNGQGIGYYFIQKKINDMEITAGSFYDQFGSGIAFRAYEARGQNLDYAIQGLRLKYYLNERWTAKAFTGKQKYLFGTYDPIIKGFNIEGNHPFNDKISILPGVSVVNRTMDEANANSLLNNINQYPISQRFDVKRNVFIYSAYNTINIGDFSLFGEFAYKTKEAVYNNIIDTIVNPDNTLILKQTSGLQNLDGNVIFLSSTYSKNGLGVTVQYKRTDHFEFRTSPNESINNGLIAYIPPLTKLNTYRLTGRYAPATQLLGENAYQVDVFYKMNKKHEFALNYSDVTNLDFQRLYRELYMEWKWSYSKNLKMLFGVQAQHYNIGAYQKSEIPGILNNTGSRLLKSVTPFADITYKINRKESMRFEVSHMGTKQDLGSWAWALIEYNIAPKYSFSLMDMFNYGNPDANRRLHYYTAFAAANFGKNRITAGYVKQVEGVICNGGVCRLEPAFNGFRCTITSNF